MIAGETNPDWPGFSDYLDELNSNINQVRYKLIFATRHGEGYHNVKEREVGTAAWEVRRLFPMSLCQMLTIAASPTGPSWKAMGKPSGRMPI